MPTPALLLIHSLELFYSKAYWRVLFQLNLNFTFSTERHKLHKNWKKKKTKYTRRVSKRIYLNEISESRIWRIQYLLLNAVRYEKVKLYRGRSLQHSVRSVQCEWQSWTEIKSWKVMIFNLLIMFTFFVRYVQVYLGRSMA